MIDTLISHLAPHYCCSCGAIGAILCEHCIYDITSEKFSACIACGTTTPCGICDACDLPYARAWCVGERSGALQRLIGDFKFQNIYAAHCPLADMLSIAVDQLPASTCVVPVPTARAHVRERGYDHALLIARRFAKQRGLKLAPILQRASNTKQRDASRSQRIQQAKAAFRIKGRIEEDVPYLLIDDVVTTGATVQYAAQQLRDAGVREVWVAAIARQPLD